MIGTPRISGPGYVPRFKRPLTETAETTSLIGGAAPATAGGSCDALVPLAQEEGSGAGGVAAPVAHTRPINCPALLAYARYLARQEGRSTATEHLTLPPAIAPDALVLGLRAAHRDPTGRDGVNLGLVRTLANAAATDGEGGRMVRLSALTNPHPKGVEGSAGIEHLGSLTAAPGNPLITDPTRETLLLARADANGTIFWSDFAAFQSACWERDDAAGRARTFGTAEATMAWDVLSAHRIDAWSVFGYKIGGRLPVNLLADYLFRGLLPHNASGESTFVAAAHPIGVAGLVAQLGANAKRILFG